MDLLALVDEQNAGVASIGYGVSETVDTYIAVAFIKKGNTPKPGDDYAFLGDSETVEVDGSTMPAIVKDLAYRNKGIFIPAGFVNGTKADTVNMKDAITYGLRIMPKLTGEVLEMFTLVLYNFYQNVVGLNALRGRSTDWDIIIFTNNSYEVYYAKNNEAQIGDVIDAVTGNNQQPRNGRIIFGARGKKGQVVPVFGVDSSVLFDDKIGQKFAFTLVPGTLTNLTAAACSGEYKRYNRTTGSTVSSMLFTITPVVACVTYSIMKVVNGEAQPAIGANDATINTSTGTVTFPAAHPAGTTRYIITVQNETGVRGEFYLEVFV